MACRDSRPGRAKVVTGNLTTGSKTLGKAWASGYLSSSAVNEPSEFRNDDLEPSIGAAAQPSSCRRRAGAAHRRYS